MFPLVVATAQAGTAVTADSINLINEDEAGSVTLRLLEEVAHPGGADANKHLDELAAADGKEGYASLAGNGSSQQGLPGARRADQQQSSGDAGPQFLELFP